jgi:ABC-type sugar transport system permease subunit
LEAATDIQIDSKGIELPMSDKTMIRPSSSPEGERPPRGLHRLAGLWPSRWHYHDRMKVIGFLFTAPVLLFFLAFSIYPVLSAFVLSFFQYDLFSPMQWTGRGNYVSLAQDKKFWQAVEVTLTYTVTFGPISWVIGFTLAMLIKEKVPGRGFFRSIFFAPTILSAVAMATAWSLLLRKNGPINAILGLSIPWLTNQQTALWGIVLMSVWQGIGWFMVVFLAGLQGIPDVYYEAAEIDGANGWRLLRHITLPMMRPIFALVVIQTIIGGMKVFTPMFIMTGGGPNNVTRSLAMLIYHEGLRDLRMGRASAISMTAFLFILVLTIVQLRLFRVHEDIGV